MDMRFRSKKMSKRYQERRKLVAELLSEHPVCQRCHAARSSEVHELVSRARGGSILDRSNCVALCHTCHRWITEHPAEAHAQGWLRHSWDNPKYLSEVEGMPE